MLFNILNIFYSSITIKYGKQREFLLYASELLAYGIFIMF